MEEWAKLITQLPSSLLWFVAIVSAIGFIYTSPVTKVVLQEVGKLGGLLSKSTDQECYAAMTLLQKDAKNATSGDYRHHLSLAADHFMNRHKEIPESPATEPTPPAVETHEEPIT